MGRRAYINDFLDVNGKYTMLESERNLNELEWTILENEHNIEELAKKNIAYDFLVKEADAKEDTLNLRDKK